MLDPLHRFSVEQYHAIVRHGIIPSGERVELLEGVLFHKKPRTPAVTFATQTLREVLMRVVTTGWFVDGQEPITTPDSEPEPDLSIVRGERRIYLEQDRHPGPYETPLVVETSETTLDGDRQFKGRIYARANVAEYWIVNLVDRRVEVYTDPSGPGDHPVYRQQRDYPAGDEVPVRLDGVEVGRIRVDDLLV
jgi:Uma2 family endonuclease